MTNESIQPALPVQSTDIANSDDDDIGTINEGRQIQSKAYDKITSTKGMEDGLFRCCMKAIRSGHVQSNRLRMGIVVAGMFTDKIMYRDIISCFYAVTVVAERKMYELAKLGDPICIKLVTYNFNRTQNYEQDLQKLFLLTIKTKNDNVEDWKKHVDTIVENNKATKEYINRIENAIDGTDIAAVLFVLWGGLIIGGGAIAMKRISKLCGNDCVHLYDNINYECNIEREQNKEQFYILYDSLATVDETNFHTIVNKCTNYMNCNNTIFVTFQRNPWWYQPLCVGTATSLCIAVVAGYIVWSQKGKNIKQ
jgi:hypothetical protein